MLDERIARDDRQPEAAASVPVTARTGLLEWRSGGVDRRRRWGKLRCEEVQTDRFCV